MDVQLKFAALGVEGPTDDAAVRALRARQQRNFIATLMLSQGVPMLLAGDELGRTQRGNNNAYCQDNETSWVDWALAEGDAALLHFTQALIALRRAHPVLRRRDFFQGRPLIGGGVRDILWLKPDGSEMTEQEWRAEHARALAVFLAGDGLTETDARGRPLRDDHLLLLFNASAAPVAFHAPALPGLAGGRLLVDTAGDEPLPDRPFDAAAPFQVGPRALALVRFPRQAPA